MKKPICLALALLLLISLPLLAACKKDEEPDTTYNPDLEIHIWTLSGTTGFGMAQLMEKTEKDEATLNYQFENAGTDAAAVSAALISGDADIGAVPTNLASTLYSKKPGEFVLLAINTRGVLYLMVNTASVEAPESLADLAGKKIYCPAQNPALITKALLDEAEVEGYELDTTTYAEAANLQTALANGLVDYAILPEPMVTIAKSSAKEGVTLAVALDITEEWDEYFEEGSLVQGCIVARKAFVEDHPEELKVFMEEYEASVEFVRDNPKEGAEMIVSAGIFAKAPVAEKAIPGCNLCFLTGEEMKAAMETYLAAMPVDKIGGALPGEDFYYGI